MSLLVTHGRSLNDESLRTLFAETEAILNLRPLTVETMGHVKSEQPLSPNNILTMKTKVVMPPPGEFVRVHEFSRMHWRRVHTQLINFGKDGGRSFYQLSSTVRSGTRIEENL